MRSVRIDPVTRDLCPLALGGSYFGADPFGTQRQNLWDAMETALNNGINHFDTANGYGNGASERLLGDFLKGRHEQAFIASKANMDDMSASAMLEEINKSLERLQTDVIDLYYIHWPRTGKDMRPLMEGLETARQQGKIRAIGVSNFSVADMEQVSEVGTINAHQIGYNLFWRYAEADVIPWCVEHNVAVTTYSSIAQGILAGKFPRKLGFPEGDGRARIVFFQDAVWPHVFEGVAQLKTLAQQAGRPLTHLAIRWVLAQPGIHTAIVGGRKASQVADNAGALEGNIEATILDEMTTISDQVREYIPDVGNMFGYYP